jgi:hypothetical protein
MRPRPTPAPPVGSYALTELEGRHHLARIVGRTAGGDCTIALPLLPDRASGNRTVALDELIDGTPLADRERAELERLELELQREGRHPKAKRERAEALRDRLIHATVMTELMKRLPDPLRRASRVAA